MKAQLNHIALLVEDLDQIVQSQLFSSLELGPVETFESEGTKEIYIGPNCSTAKMLLLEAISDGPYKRAMQSRGPGLHHICIDVLNILDFLDTLSGSGWYLHTSSLHLYQNCKQVFLARSSTPVLIEVNEVKKFSKQTHYIKSFHFPLNKYNLIDALSCPSLYIDDSSYFKLNNRTLSIESILKV
ncbi:MAG: hypothetical protein KC646_10735 [Candidatus Cloacimonetes bacterium]|nr:hypothetical protein [Candidatus Cloacimonadota bacterium]